jgi:hypothetical protein
VGKAALSRAIERWGKLQSAVPPPGRLSVWESGGFRIVCPGDAEWPTQLDGWELQGRSCSGCAARRPPILMAAVSVGGRPTGGHRIRLARRDRTIG